MYVMSPNLCFIGTADSRHSVEGSVLWYHNDWVLWWALYVNDVLQAKSSAGKRQTFFLRCFPLVWVILEEQMGAEEE